jgi:hypothetical protein
MDTQTFLDAIARALVSPEETLLERLGELLLEAHAAEIERAKSTGQPDIQVPISATSLTESDA